MVCSHCKKPGYQDTQCYFKIGFPKSNNFGGNSAGNLVDLGNSASSCNNGVSGSKEGITSNYCKKTGYMIKDCYKLKFNNQRNNNQRRFANIAETSGSGVGNQDGLMVAFDQSQSSNDNTINRHSCANSAGLFFEDPNSFW